MNSSLDLVCLSPAKKHGACKSDTNDSFFLQPLYLIQLVFLSTLPTSAPSLFTKFLCRPNNFRNLIIHPSPHQNRRILNCKTVLVTWHHDMQAKSRTSAKVKTQTICEIIMFDSTDNTQSKRGQAIKFTQKCRDNVSR